MTMETKFKITLFNCINSVTEETISLLNRNNNCEIETVKMACSGMTKDLYLLKAFEAGSDAVIVFVCPEGACRYMEGSIRARKRVGWVKKILDEIGIGGDRLSIHNVVAGDSDVVNQIFLKTLGDLEKSGKNPAV